tara:strand:+ start:9622 stop:12009 length:2388 start_codon:yes stop_codon:yes gene_type:complete
MLVNRFFFDITFNVCKPISRTLSRKENNQNNQSVLLDIEGMKCGGCVRSVENVLTKQPNIIKASVNLVTGTAWIDFGNSEKDLNKVIKELNEKGFLASRRTEKKFNNQTISEMNVAKSWWNQWRQLMIALVLLLFSVLGHLAEGQVINLPLIGTLPFHASLATVALLGPGLGILKRGLKSAVALAPTMDSLVGLGVSSAYLASLVALIWPGAAWPCFFNEPVMLLGFVLLGRFLEERARFRTSKALTELAELQPETARLFIDNNEIREVRVGALKPGERLQLLAGDRIPVDGIVIEGNSAVDVSSLTGESIPVNACPGIELASGSLNLEANLVLEVKRIGAESALARIVALVEEAQARKAPIQGLADRVAGNFCYGVVTLSLATFIFWWQIGADLWPEVLHASGQGLIHQHGLHSSLGGGAQTPLGLALQLSIAVLVVACPCALGLATPTVITVASGLAAKRGWLFKGGDVIERAASLDQIIFDKTGTLTIGRPQVVDYLCTDNPDKMLQLAASLETNSRHPLGHAIVQKSEEKKLSLLKTSTTKTYPGKGISGEIIDMKGTIRVGTIEWVKSEGVNWNDSIENQLNQSNLIGHSIVAVAHQENLLGLISIDDKLREDVNIALERLRKAGLVLNMLSGDRRQAVERLGKKLGFTTSQLGWQLLPNQKLLRLQELQVQGSIAMVGDGINDAPALAASDLGIAVGTGTQIAKDSADLVLLGEKLEGLPDALFLAKQTMKKIKQNLIWAFGYNMIALPIAAGLLLPGFGLVLSPPIAALLMALSSITVVVNALSLKTT